ncbi:hypothetical protein DSO57_1026214 [Entomophthora muscae]|uniref:Uncharacterized protein n=1 Tax=Entomophthora muscae TaxID=34485 RepID=A0ACC2T2K5_9FUNG|nr:hypothetical protein DSO57_1026214 [Entomophthora muscae]
MPRQNLASDWYKFAVACRNQDMNPNVAAITYAQGHQDPMSGACPSGGPHTYTDSYTMCGIAWAAICFPIGIICCYATRENKYTKCLIVVKT